MSHYVQSPTISNDSGCVLGVSLNLNERVEWVYTTMPDGRRVVTGYDILPILPENPEPSTQNTSRTA